MKLNLVQGTTRLGIEPTAAHTLKGSIIFPPSGGTSENYKVNRNKQADF